MNHFSIISGAIATFVLLSFLIVEALGVPLLVDPSAWLYEGGIGAALIGGGLLLGDVFLPVPSSVIMIAHGAVVGIVGGTLLSLVSSVGGAMIGWWIGHRGKGRLQRLISPTGQQNANRLLGRWGVVAIVISRFLPIVAETVSIMSGTTSLGWRKVLMATTIGTLPAALIYAIAGSLATDLASGALVTGAVILLAGLTAIIGKWLTAPMGHATTIKASASPGVPAGHGVISVERNVE